MARNTKQIGEHRYRLVQTDDRPNEFYLSQEDNSRDKLNGTFSIHTGGYVRLYWDPPRSPEEDRLHEIAIRPGNAAWVSIWCRSADADEVRYQIHVGDWIIEWSPSLPIIAGSGETVLLINDIHTPDHFTLLPVKFTNYVPEIDFINASYDDQLPQQSIQLPLLVQSEEFLDQLKADLVRWVRSQ